ncbi:glycosyltransferase family 1 protein [Dyella sp. EPa41]|uniref:glycosyltransferase family 4 protein n=1 Tax=Dyella sp. EPa41 TaxID=1561194 RepID=UPI00210495FC|nr:glycosyltransferase family 1 protein [Dyella sp. EPa41]
MSNLIIAADLRWPEGTGIGICQNQYLARAPKDIGLHALHLRFRIGHPASPFEVGARLSLQKYKSHVFWSPGFIPPAWSSIPSVVTVHDLTHLHFYSPFHARYYDFVLRPMYRRCTAIICVSEFTRNEFIEWSGVDPCRVHVVHNGVTADYHSDIEPHRPGYPYIFYPGNKRSYKNLDMLLRAYACSTLPGLGIKVVMTGTATPELQSTINALGIEGDVVFLGFVPDDRLPSLYRGAEFTAFISQYEGFGLPIVESMAVGTPVLTSNVSSMPEIASDAARIVSPYDRDEIVQAMDELASNSRLRATLTGKGLDRASAFSWDRAAAATWNVIRSTAGKS